MGQPAPVANSILWVVSLITVHPALWNGCFVLVQAALGLCLLIGRFERAAIIASIPWALGIWWVGEGFGLLPTGFALFAAGAPGAVLYYPLLGLLGWPHPTAGSRINDVGVRRRAGLHLWAGLWLGGAALMFPWRFSPGRLIQANFEEYSSGQPSWLGRLSSEAFRVVGPHSILTSVGLAVAEALIGVGALHATTRRAALGAGLVVLFVFWVVVQCFGGIFAGDATDPGAAPLAILFGLALWPIHQGALMARRPLPSRTLVLRPAARVTIRAGRGARAAESDSLLMS